MVAIRSGVRYLISTMPSGSSTPPAAPGSAYISTYIHAMCCCTLRLCEETKNVMSFTLYGMHHDMHDAICPC